MQLGRYRTVFTGVTGTPWVSLMHFEDAATPAGFYIEFLQDFWGAIFSYVTDSVSGSVEAEVVYFEDSTGAIDSVQSGEAAGFQGVSEVDPLPFANQALIQWRTGQYVGGREIRGKTFVPGLTEDASTGGLIAGNVVSGIQAAANELISDGNGALRVYSPTRGTSAPVTSATVTNRFAVLRSRRD